MSFQSSKLISEGYQLFHSATYLWNALFWDTDRICRIDHSEENRKSLLLQVQLWKCQQIPAPSQVTLHFVKENTQILQVSRVSIHIIYSKSCETQNSLANKEFHRNPHEPHTPLRPRTTIRAKAPLEDLEAASHSEGNKFCRRQTCVEVTCLMYLHVSSVSSTLDFSYRTNMINLNETSVEKAGQAANAKMIKLGDCKITQIRFTPNFPVSYPDTHHRGECNDDCGQLRARREAVQRCIGLAV